MKLTIFPENIRLKFDAPARLTDLLSRTSISIVYPCGGSATCGKCKIRFLEGSPEPTYADTVFFSARELKNGYRLACDCTLEDPGVIRIPQASRISPMPGLSAPADRPMTLNPYVIKKKIKKKSRNISHLRSDEQLILENCKQAKSIDLPALKKLPNTISAPDSELTLTIAKDRIIDIELGDTQNDIYGCAVDLGTTTIVAGLYDLHSGQTVGIQSMLNPQIDFGEDLISRIAYISENEKRLGQLRGRVIDSINQMITDICNKNAISNQAVYQVVIAGNAAQNHILCGLSPYSLSIAPFTPVFKNIRNIKAGEIDLRICPVAPVWILPNLGGFVGGDVVADMLLTGLHRKKSKTTLLIDIGTNCEVVLQHKGHMIAASSPAGPALEGACISNGMRAAAGAIYDVRIESAQIRPLTIHNQPALGICGSGLFHIIAECLKNNRIRIDGRIKDDIIITPEVHLTQDDVREFQLAKSAIAAAWKTLCSIAGITETDIDAVFIAGAFGNYIRPEAAIDLGLVPQINRSSIHFVGNASFAGSRMALLSKKYVKQAADISHTVDFVELAGRPDFQEKYIHNMNLNNKGWSS